MKKLILIPLLFFSINLFSQYLVVKPSQLPAASMLNLSDIFIIGQGTTTKKLPFSVLITELKDTLGGGGGGSFTPINGLFNYTEDSPTGIGLGGSLNFDTYFDTQNHPVIFNSIDGHGSYSINLLDQDQESSLDFSFDRSNGKTVESHTGSDNIRTTLQLNNKFTQIWHNENRITNLATGKSGYSFRTNIDTSGFTINGINDSIQFLAEGGAKFYHNGILVFAINEKGFIYTDDSNANTSMGNLSFNSLTVGEANTGFGASALYNLTSGSYNTAIGQGSLFGINSQSYNIGIGYYAGKNNVSLNNRLFINSLDRSDLAGDTTKSIIYGQQASIIANQRLYFNAGKNYMQGDIYKYNGISNTDTVAYKSDIRSYSVSGSGVSSYIPFWNATKNITGVSEFTWDDANKKQVIIKNDLQAATLPAIELNNNTASTVSVTVQQSPSIYLKGAAWNTTAGTNSTHTWRIYNGPSSATTSTSGLNFQSSIDAGAFTTRMSVTSGGALSISSISASSSITTTQATTSARASGLLAITTTAASAGTKVRISPKIISTAHIWNGSTDRTHTWDVGVMGDADTEKSRYVISHVYDGTNTRNLLEIDGLYNTASTNKFGMSDGLSYTSPNLSVTGGTSGAFGANATGVYLSFDSLGTFEIKKDSKTTIDSKNTNGITVFKLDKYGNIYNTPPHCALYRNTDLTISATQNIWYKISGFTSKDAHSLVVQGDSVQFTYAGSYLINFTISFSGLNNEVWETAVFKGGAMEEPSQLRYTGTSDVGNMSCPVYVSVTAGQWISFRIRNTTDNDDPTIKRFSAIITTQHLQ